MRSKLVIVHTCPSVRQHVPCQAQQNWNTKAPRAIPFFTSQNRQLDGWLNPTQSFHPPFRINTRLQTLFEVALTHLPTSSSISWPAYLNPLWTGYHLFSTMTTSFSDTGCWAPLPTCTPPPAACSWPANLNPRLTEFPLFLRNTQKRAPAGWVSFQPFHHLLHQVLGLPGEKRKEGK